MNGLQIDELLVARSQNGDRNAFDQLLQRHQARAYQYAFRLTKDADEAGDIVAETLLRMFKAIPKFKGKSSFNTWMYRITKNCFLDAKKKSSRTTVSLESTLQTENFDLQYQFADTGPSPFDDAVLSQEMASVQLALDQLPKAQRSILIMHHADLRTYEEMAQVLGVPVGTVKSRLNRARRGLCLVSG